MSGSTARTPRAVVVTRPTEYDELLVRHATAEQARFFLEARGQSLAQVRARHDRIAEALAAVSCAIPARWRRTRVDRGDLSRFVFEPDDLVVAVGQDGLVANVAKYLGGQLVVGVNPDPERFDGVLVRHLPEALAALLPRAAVREVEVEHRTMVAAELDDGQRLLALNEVFAGHVSHQSARYRLAWSGRSERQSSSGVVVSTGTGATGWCRSIAHDRHTALALPVPESPRLAFFVREAWPSRTTGANLTEGLLEENQELEIVSEMNDGGVVFGDGIEPDRLAFGWGMRLRVRKADQSLALVH